MSRVLGIDYGERRIGIAVSDPLGLTAQPLEVVSAGEFASRISELIEAYDVDTVVVGVPRPLGGGESVSSLAARALGDTISESGVEVVYVDERYTSKMAEDALLTSGMKRRRRRSIVDKVAAAIILQTYLDGNQGAPGDVVDPATQ